MLAVFVTGNTWDGNSSTRTLSFKDNNLKLLLLLCLQYLSRVIRRMVIVVHAQSFKDNNLKLLLCLQYLSRVIRRMVIVVHAHCHLKITT